MIKNENGVLVGYVFVDIDAAERDLGGWVSDAKKLVGERVALPPGYRLAWTGQYELMAEVEDRLRYVIPLTLVLVVALLYLSLRAWPQTLLVLTSLPFALAGSVCLLAARGPSPVSPPAPASSWSSISMKRAPGGHGAASSAPPPTSTPPLSRAPLRASARSS
jgi:Cu/Ag efflux pump CusA